MAFLFRVRTGPCDDSFGIHVAKMAGVPATVVSRAGEILRALESGTFDPLRNRDTVRARVTVATLQVNLFSEAQRGAVEALAQVTTETMTPLEALAKLDELTRRLKE